MNEGRMMYTESIRGYPYMPKHKLAEELGVSVSTVGNRMKGIQNEIDGGRYNEYAIIDDGNIVLINTLVMLDYMKYHKRLNNKNLRKYVPEFRPEELIKIMGWNDRIVVVDDGKEDTA